MDIAYELYKKFDNPTPALIIVADPTTLNYAYALKEVEHLRQEVRNDIYFLDALCSDDEESFADVQARFIENTGLAPSDWERDLDDIITDCVACGLVDYFESEISKMANGRELSDISRDECDLAIPASIKAYAKENYENCILDRIDP